jgi:tRNA (guanine-N7-)-methyltransferase
VAEKIRAFRMLNPGQYDNISVVRANCMKHLCHYFAKNSIEKIFICFPDPHFKAKKYKRRIISTGFLSEYAFLLKPHGRIYCITDVEELHHWHLHHLNAHSQFS